MMKDDVRTPVQGSSDGSLSLDRREFLKLLGPGIFVFFSLDELSLAQQRAQRGYPEDFNAYLKIGQDGRVTCYSGKIEQGQGNTTALAQMLAEELEVSFDSVDMIMGDTKLCPWDGGTVGSRSIKYFGPALRAAGAEAREVLIQLGAERLKVPADRLMAVDGAVVERNHARNRVSYASLAGGRQVARHLENKPALKQPTAFKVCGKSLPRKDGLDKVTGKAKFAADMRPPGMLYGRILRPPAHGAELKSLDTSGAERVKGARVIRDADLAAALHATPDGAEAALACFKAEFSKPEPTVDDATMQNRLESLASEGQVLEQKGDLATGRQLSKVLFEHTYYTPYIAHAATETHSATAEVGKDEATVWISTQRPFGMQEEIARAISMPAEKVRVITPYVGGGFGGKSQGRQAVEAARLSKLAGAPVQVMWTREEEFFYDTFRPAAIVRIKSGLDEAGRIVYWDYGVFFAGERSSQNIYEIPHFRTTSGGAARGGPSPHPFGTGAWRGPGSNTNIFARESHMDIMAARTGIDPVEFRLKNLNNERMARVLRAAAEKFKWTPAKGPSGRGHGVVLLDYLNTYVAGMAEVEVDKRTGQVRVKRVTIAQDLGQGINPEGIRVQIEGCVTMGLSSVLTEEVHFRGGEIRDRNFDTYDTTRFSWVPDIETVLVENPEIAPQGCGEPAITCMAALLANAVFDATGARVLRLPLTPERIREKMQAG
jgi:isoquinoline 1-oxidoreductase